jgi:hypothetical protein
LLAWQGIHPSWLKIAELKRLLEPEDQPYDWIWSLDLDAFIMNTTLGFGTHVLQAPGAVPHPHNVSLVLAADCNGINGGSFFIRRTPWSLNLLDRVWALRHATPDQVKYVDSWWEQAALTHVFEQMGPQEVADNVAVVPQVRVWAGMRCLTAWQRGYGHCCRSSGLCAMGVCELCSC